MSANQQEPRLDEEAHERQSEPDEEYDEEYDEYSFHSQLPVFAP